MDLKYSRVIKNSLFEQAYEMMFFGAIGYDINADDFAKELKYIGDSGQSITIYINSVGGSVTQGYSVVGILKALEAKGVNIQLFNIGVAYSMGGVILASGQKGNRKSYPYATTMIHDPYMVDQTTLSESDKQFIDTTRQSLAQIISDSINKPIDDVLQKMKDETFMSASQSLEYGIIDEIIGSTKELKGEFKNPMEKMAACANLFNNNQKSMKEVNAILGLQSEAGEMAAVQAITALKDTASKVDALKKELEAEKAKVATLVAENKTIKDDILKDKAASLVNKAIEEGKISKDSSEKWIENAVANFDGTQELLKSLTGKATSVNAQLSQEDEKAMAEKYSKLLDTPQELDRMDKEELKKMEDAYAKFKNVIIHKTA